MVDISDLVRQPHDLSLERLGAAAPVLAERDAVDDGADALDRIRVHALARQKGAGVGVVLGMEELVVVRVMQQRRERDDRAVAARAGVRDDAGVAVHAQRVRRVVPVGIRGKERGDIVDCA